MAIDFPNSPTTGDTYTVNGRTWKWDGTTWAAYGNYPDPTVFKVDTTSGYVGINNISPTVALDVTGSAVFSGSITVDGDFTVSGTTTTINTTQLNVEDNIITLNYGVTGTPSLDAGIEVERGDETNAQLLWDESAGAWVVSSDFTVDTGTLHVDSTNNRVGIGTTSPAEELHIAKDQNGDLTQILIENLDQRVRIGSYYEAGVIQYGKIQSEQDGGGDIVLALNPEGGNVGIGTTSPTDSLDINGTLNVRDHIDFSDTTPDPANRVAILPHGYDIYTDNAGAGGNNTRLWVDGPNQGEVVIGPRGGASILGNMRLRSSSINLEGNATTAGYALMPNQPFVQAKSPGGGYVTPSSSTLWTELNSSYWGANWSTSQNIGSHFDPSTARLTAPVSGVYFMMWTAYYNTLIAGSGSYIHPTIFINGSFAWNNGQQPYVIYGYNYAGLQNGVSVSYTFYLSAGDYVAPACYFRSTNDQFYGSYSYLSAGLLH